MAVNRQTSESGRPKRPPATTPQAREDQLIAASFDLADKQISNGSVSAQVLTHYLKLGSSRERLEQQKLRQENELLKARVEQMLAAAHSEEMYAAALNAMRLYSGQEVSEDHEQYEV